MTVVHGRKLAQELEALLEQLQSLDALDPAWTDVERVIRNAQALLQAKAQQRAEWQRTTNVARHLSEFAATFADDLSFHEIEWPEQWSAANAVYVADREQADQVRQLLEQIGSLFQKHRALREEQAAATSGKQLRGIRAQLAEVEAGIEESHQELAVLLREARVVVEAPAADVAEVQTTGPVPEGEPGAETESALTPEPLAQPVPECAAEPEREPEPRREEVSEPEARPEAEVQPEAQVEPPRKPEADSEAAVEPAAEAAAPEPEEVREAEPERVTAPAAGEVPAADARHEGVAEEELAPEDPRRWLWNRIEAGDLAAAYWLSHGVGLPPWLLKACLLARHIRVSGDEASSALAAIIYEHPNPIGEAESSGLTRTQAELLTAAASLGPALKAPETGALGWLQAAGSLSRHVSFLASILDFATRGIALGPEAIAEGRSQEQRRAELSRLRREAEEWLTQQRSARLTYALATDALHEIVSADHILSRAVTAVVNDDRKAYGLVRRVLDEYLSSQDSMDWLIIEAVKKLRGPSAPRIVGKPLETIFSRLHAIRDVLSAWSDLVREPEPEQKGWRESQIAAFREAFRSAWSECQSGPPGALLTDSKTACLARLLWVEADALARTVILPGSGEQPGEEVQLPLLAVLRRPLLLLVPAPITSQGGVPEALSSAQVRALAAALSEGVTVREALERQLKARDFLAARLLLEEEELAGDAQLRTRVEQQLLETVGLLRERVENLRRDLELSTVLHVVTDAERADFEGRLLSVESLLDGHQRCSELIAECDRIEQELNHLRKVRINSLRERITELDEDIERAEEQTREAAERYRSNALEALDRGDLALADEYLSLAERTLQYGYEEEEDVHLSKLPPDRFERFRIAIEGLTKKLEEDDRGRRTRVRDQLAAGKGIPDVLDQANVPGARKVEIAAALDGFRYFKSGPSPKLEKEHEKYVKDIMTYLGFQRPSAVQRRTAAASCWHYEVHTTDAGASPLPHFGSQRNGIYDLLVVWERPNAERLGQIVQETHTTTRCPIILFLGRLSFKQREEWGAYCKKHELTVLLVDETLLYWLAGIRENRLRHAVAYSLPWGYANPYTPVAGGLVPPEMFVGRKSIIRELADPKGSAIIYGGRQLGKSAILRAIQRDYHRPEQKQFVYYNDIRNLGKVQDISEIWRQLRGWAVAQKLIDPKVLDRRENLTAELVKYFEKNPEARVLVLLDEADNFLAADARNQFGELHELKKLMDQTDRRFKVVFSGLHSVQRYCAMPNHPFAHLNPIGIGPLDPADARTLIVEPMQMLGFVFTEESERAIYRIFAITNYHPALIQHICSELVRNRRVFRPPYRLTVKMIEDLARQPSVRQFISERFVWTVGLDPRYEGLVYSMILEQSGDRDGFRRQFTAREALELARSWWPKGFDRMMPEEAASLLRELVGLGVLVQLDSGSFRLRNANVVRMLGSQTEILERMAQLAEMEPEQEFDPRKLRMKLPDERQAWSPLTLEQEAELEKSQTGVHLVFCSHAQGRRRLVEALERVVRGPAGAQTEGAVLTPPPECLSLNGFRAFLDNNLSRTQSGRYIIHMTATHLFNCADPPRETLAQIKSLLLRRRSRQRMLHCVVSFDAEETVRWYRDLQLGEAEDSVNSVAVCYPWPREMIRHCLEVHGMIVNQAVIDEVAVATGGWPVLVEEMMQRLPHGSLENFDPRDACRSLRSELEQQGELSWRFLADVGLQHVPLGRDICRLVVDLEPGDFNEIPADLIPGARDESEVARDVLILQRLGVLRRDGERVVCDPVVRVAMGL